MALIGIDARKYFSFKKNIRKGMKFPVKKILVIKLCCLGDILFLTPTLRSLRKAYPDAQITMLVSSWVKELIDCIPFVDDYILYDAPFRTSLVKKIVETLSTIVVLRRRHFDLVVVGHRRNFFGFLAFLSGAKTRIGFHKTVLLTKTVHFDENRHEVDRYLSMADALGISAAGNETELRPRTEDLQVVHDLLDTHQTANGDIVVGIFAGGGNNPGTWMPIKRWYPECYGQLINVLLQEFHYRVVLLGSESEKVLNDEILSYVKQPEQVLNLVGKTTLPRLIALASKCSLFIGGDSGPTHIAAAVGTPTIMLFGPSDPRLVAPRGRAVRYMWKRVECSPCYTPLTVMDKTRFRGNEFTCWTGTHECMGQITVADVLEEVRTLLNLRPDTIKTIG